MQTSEPPALGLADVVNSCSLSAGNQWRAWKSAPRQVQYPSSGFLLYQVGRNREALKIHSSCQSVVNCCSSKAVSFERGSRCIKLAETGGGIKSNSIRTLESYRKERVKFGHILTLFSSRNCLQRFAYMFSGVFNAIFFSFTVVLI